jgi:molybdopterin-guanine dinucleotide biosynthesis protein B
MMPPFVISIVGRPGSGKTTFLIGVVRALKARGYRVGTVKHHVHPGISFDREGKDSWHHAQAGADEVIISAPDQIVTLRALPRELSLDRVVEQFHEVDVVLTDGYRLEGQNRIEILRREVDSSPTYAPDELFAIATDCQLEFDLPILGLDDFEAAADLIESLLLTRSGSVADREF